MGKKKIKVFVPGGEGLILKAIPLGYSGGEGDFQNAGIRIYEAIQHLPIGVYEVIERNIVSDLLSKTYTLGELQELRNGIEKIGNEAMRKREGINSLFSGRDWETWAMYKVLGYVIANKQD